MLSSEDHLERKGRLRMVRQFIDQILEQPEWLEADLQPGTVDDAACWLAPEQFADEPAAPVFLDRKPFDVPGPSSGLHFLYEDDDWGDEEGTRYFILCDPRGIVGGDNADHIARYADPERAVEVAESLSEQVGIRLAVARERRRYSSRG
jgi:hypothetical protein